MLNIIRRDPQTGRMRPLTGRQTADARKRIRRACDRWAAAGLLVKVGIGWTLPAETSAEAKVRRKRTRTSEKQEQRRTEWVAAPVIDRSTRAKLIKILGMLGSNSDGEVVAAARQAERVRTELDCSWADLLAS